MVVDELTEAREDSDGGGRERGQLLWALGFIEASDNLSACGGVVTSGGGKLCFFSFFGNQFYFLKWGVHFKIISCMCMLYCFPK